MLSTDWFQEWIKLDHDLHNKKKALFNNQTEINEYKLYNNTVKLGIGNISIKCSDLFIFVNICGEVFLIGWSERECVTILFQHLYYIHIIDLNNHSKFIY